MKLSECITYIKSDYYRYNPQKNIGIGSYINSYIRNGSIKYSFWLRLCKCNIWGIYFLARVMHKLLSVRYQIQISYQCDIGYGLFIGHCTSIVISSYVKIGNNCNLSQFTSIGSNYNRAAKIGDNVYIGPNVSIVGDVNIGSNVTIGAGSVVVKNIEPNITVAGNPAAFISNKKPARYIVNKFKLK